MRKNVVFLFLAFALLLASCGGGEETAAPAETEAPPVEEAAPSGEQVQLVIESWRNDDLTIWEDKIIPVSSKFSALSVEHPTEHPNE